jgi:hypothetical protein
VAHPALPRSARKQNFIPQHDRFPRSVTSNVRARRQLNAKSSFGRSFQASRRTNNLFELIQYNASETYVYLVAVLALHGNLALGPIGDDRHSGPSSEGRILPHNARDVQHSAVFFKLSNPFHRRLLDKSMFIMQSTTQSRQLWCVHRWRVYKSCGRLFGPRFSSTG